MEILFLESVVETREIRGWMESLFLESVAETRAIGESLFLESV
jgi:hypothetical protein